ncbi:MAG: cation transporter [Chloroflexota bacterium]|nr:cation transporter [Chloroflexota bacterium]
MQPREADLRRALALSSFSIAWSGVVGAISAAVAIGTGSLSLLGFGLDATIDAAASVILVWRFLIEARRPHHAARAERLAERAVGVALLLVSAYLAIGSARALLSHETPQRSVLAVALLAASVLVLPPLAVAKRRVAVRLESGALRGDAVLTAIAGLLAAIGLLSTGLAATVGAWWADAAAALVVALIVAREGLSTLRGARGA